MLQILFCLYFVMFEKMWHYTCPAETTVMLWNEQINFITNFQDLSTMKCENYYFIYQWFPILSIGR